MDPHPLCKVFPMMSAEDQNALAGDIVANGLHSPIVLFEGMILDGRHRFVACSRNGVKPKFVEFEGDIEAAKAFVISANLRRRDLTPAQKAACAAEVNEFRNGGDRGGNQHQSWQSARVPTASTQSEAAKLNGVSDRTIRQAVKVRKEGVPELHEAMKSGAVSAKTAEKIAKLPPEKQRAVLADKRPDQAIKKIAREEKAQALADRTITESIKTATKKYNVIYADSPWQFATYSENGMDRSADNHYPTMTLDDIKALPVPAADDAVLFLWATVPMLPEGLEVMRAWGFTYKSQIVWVKDRIGTGYWTRNKHEILLIGTKGNIPAPVMGTQPESVIEATLSRHSAKPEIFAEIIESLFSQFPKLEMFCRSPRDGWDVLGNESCETVDGLLK